MIDEILWVFVLAVYIIFVIRFLTKKIYELMIHRGFEEKDAIYYNRKLIHIFGGGVVVLLVPIVFSSSIYPLLCGLALAIFTYIFHKRRNNLYWFQTKKNLNDVSFCVMWGISVFVLWEIMGDPWIAIMPSAFMALGDGITGIVRNAAFEKRTKHPIGNIYMATLCIPLGYYLGRLGNIEGMAIGGVLAAVAASFMERYEFGPLDDNILITVSSSIVLYIYPLIT
ncbi:MAG: hypothetical protein JSW62_00305 [Thermoplasmatales archaeon]|nr:MAG: hypothetical protein JSW62_00305 [Thermoplasmatales archaeon]